MGGDAAHQAGEFRPSKYLPFPDSIAPHPLDLHTATSCPGALFEHLLRGGDRTKPFFDIAKDGVSVDVDEDQRTLGKLQEADAHNNILVVIARKHLLDTFLTVSRTDISHVWGLYLRRLIWLQF